MISSNFCKFLFPLFVLTPFVCMTGDYARYYIPYGNVFLSLFVFVLTLTVFQDYIDFCKILDVVIYCFVSLFVLCFHLLASFQVPNFRLLFELAFACCFICLKPFVRQWVYDKFIRMLAIFFLLAIIEYALSIIGFTFILGETVRPGFGYRYYQGLFNLIPYYSIGSFFRFQFIMDEPGRVGTLCFFVLITLNRKIYKKEFIVFTVAGLISFSLAFYVLVVLYGVSKIKLSKLKYLIFLIILLGIFHEPITNQIVSRVNDGTEYGKIDKRSSLELEALYSDMWEDGSIFFGLGYKSLYSMNTGESAGLKKYVVQYGVFGFLLSFCSFSYIFLRYNRINCSNVIVLFFFWFSFYQRADLNFPSNIIVLFSYGLTDANSIPRSCLLRNRLA